MVLTIVTATYNAGTTLPALIKSLESQTSLEFSWLVVDGGSTDSTLSIVESIRGVDVRVSSQPDFGIYDALNRAVGLIETDFYLVVGADDFLNPEAVEKILQACTSDTNILSGRVVVGDKELGARGRFSMLKGMSTYVSAHSVGTVIRTSLHNKFGLYSRKYPIAADQLFIGRIANAGVQVKTIDSVLGVFGTEGVSSRDYLGTATEFCRVQIELGYNAPLQILVCALRLIRYLFIKRDV